MARPGDLAHLHQFGVVDHAACRLSVVDDLPFRRDLSHAGTQRSASCGARFLRNNVSFATPAVHRREDVIRPGYAEQQF